MWSDLAFAGGAVDNLIPAGERVLAAINMGSADRVGYRSGLLLFDGSEIRSWEHPGKLTAGVGTDGSQVLGFSAPGLDDREVQLTILTQGAKPEAFGPRVESSLVWGENMVQAHGRTCVLVAQALTGQSGQIWRVDPNTRDVDIAILHGEAGVVDNWYQVDGPSQLTSIGNQLYWLSDRRLWTADPLTGESRQVMQFGGGGWYLTGSGLVRVRYEQNQVTLERHEPADGERVEAVGPFTVELPPGMSVEGALVVPG